MERQRSQLMIIATSLLGVLAVAILVSAVFILFGAWVLGTGSGPGDDHVATFATILVGLLALALGLVATIAVRDEWLGLERGRMLGIMVAVIVLIVVIAALIVGRLHGSEPLFIVGGGLAVVTAVLLVAIDEPRPAGPWRGAVR
jgi:hypothetical protein